MHPRIIGTKTVVILLLSGFILIPLRAYTEEPENAKILQRHGLALYQQELYDEAARAFRRLLKIRPSRQVYFNIGQCEFMRKRFDLALESFNIYLEKDRNKISRKRLQYTEKVVSEIAPLVGSFDVQGETPLEVWIDDELRGNTPVDGAIYVLEGEHRLSFKKDGEVVSVDTYAVLPGDTISVQVPIIVHQQTVKTLPESPLQTNPRERPTERERHLSTVATPPSSPDYVYSPIKNIGIIVTSIGGGAIITGGVMGGMALANDRKLKDRCPDKEQVCMSSNLALSNMVMSFGTAANVLLPLGAAVAITGVTLFVVGRRKERKQDGDLSAWRIAPYAAGTEMGIWFQQGY